MEPLAALIRASPSITGLAIPGGVSKIYLYADDILLTLADLGRSLPALLETIEFFAPISGYRVNWGKSEALPLSRMTTKADILGHPFRWTPKHLKYLGILVNRGLDHMVADNLTPLIARMRLDFDKWSHLGLSLWGRTQAVRMVTVPRFTYVLGLLPLQIPLPLLRSIDAEIRTFIWGSMRPRLAPAKLMAHRSCGGLGLPSVEYYALALHLSPLATLTSDMRDPPQWIAIEKALLPRGGSMEGLYCTDSAPSTLANPILRATRAAWKRAHSLVGVHPTLHAQAPLWNNDGLRIGGRVFTWPSWREAGIVHLGQVLHDGAIRTFASLIESFGLHPSQE